MPDENNHDASALEKDLPPFAALRAFESLVRLGGVRSAARSLGTHHSVVSRHVAHLESWLGVALLERSGKRVTLHEGARDYFARISAAIAEIAMATQDFICAEKGRPVRIWCSPSLSVQWLAREIADFERQFPEHRVELKPSDVPANLHIHEADVNIFFHRDDDPRSPDGNGLQIRELARLRPIIAASPALAQRAEGITSPSDLLDLPLLHGNQKDEWRSWLKFNNVTVPDEMPGELCWNAHLALEAARLGKGLLLASHYFLDRELERGDLVEVKVPGVKSEAYASYYFIAREDRWSSPSLAAVRRYLVERMREMDLVALPSQPLIKPEAYAANLGAFRAPTFQK